MSTGAIVTFGEWNGTPVSELPDYALFQLIERRLWPQLAAAVDSELERRALMRRAALTKAA